MKNLFYVLVVLAVLLTGCGVVTPEQMQVAVNLCKEHQGLKYTTPNGSPTDRYIIAYCIDGRRMSIKDDN